MSFFSDQQSRVELLLAQWRRALETRAEWNLSSRVRKAAPARSHVSIRSIDALEQRVLLTNAAPTVSFVPHELVAGPTFLGDAAGDQFGRSVSGAGDVNGDGFADLIVGASGDDNNGSYSGSARVFSGLDGSVLHTFLGDAAGDRFGRSVSGAGDVNGDGFDDLIVGAYGDDDNGSSSGSARVFSGVDGSVLHTFLGDAAGDYFGSSVSGAGDVNGDGFDDLIVGAFGDDDNGSNSGSARVFSGVDGSVLHTFLGDAAGDRFGRSVSEAGDVNGDGFDDLIVGAYGDDDNGSFSGSARVFSGVDGSVLHTFLGDATADFFGTSVSGAGDVNGDGFADLIVGADGDDDNGTYSGSARVFSGVDGSVLHTFLGDAAGDRFGRSVSGAGDVNGDGFDDLIVGAYGDDDNGSSSGSARVFSGVDGSVLHTFLGDAAGDLLRPFRLGCRRRERGRLRRSDRGGLRRRRQRLKFRQCAGVLEQPHLSGRADIPRRCGGRQFWRFRFGCRRRERRRFRRSDRRGLTVTTTTARLPAVRGSSAVSTAVCCTRSSAMRPAIGSAVRSPVPAT